LKVLKELAHGAWHGGGGLVGHYGNVCIKAAMRSVGVHLLRQTQEARDAGVDTIYAQPGDARRARLAAVEEADSDVDAESIVAAAASTASAYSLWRAYFAETDPILVGLDHGAGHAHYPSASGSCLCRLVAFHGTAVLRGLIAAKGGPVCCVGMHLCQ